MPMHCWLMEKLSISNFTVAKQFHGTLRGHVKHIIYDHRELILLISKDARWQASGTFPEDLS